MKARDMLTSAVMVYALLNLQCLASIPSPSRPLSVVALMGQVAPDTGGARFASLSQGMLNNVGQVGFVAGLVGGDAARSAFLYSSAVTVTLTLKDSQSAVVATTQLNLPANGHLAKYVSELFPSPRRRNFQGTLDVVSTQPLVGLTLRQRNSSLTSLPVIP